MKCMILITVTIIYSEPTYDFNQKEIKTSIIQYLESKREGNSKGEEIYIRSDFEFLEDDFKENPLYIADVILMITALSSRTDHYMTLISEMDSVYQDLWSDIFASYLAIPSERSNEKEEEGGDKDNKANDNEHKSNIQQLLDDIARLQKKIENMTKDNQELQAVISEYEDNMQKQEKNKHNLNEIIGNLERKNNEIINQKAILESKFEKQAETIAEFEKKIGEHNEKNAQLKEQYKNDLGILRRNSTFAKEQNVVTDKDDMVNMLQIKITQLERERQNQTKRRSFIEIDNTNQGNAIILLTKENGKLKEIINQNIEEIEKEKTNLEEFNTLIESLRELNAKEIKEQIKSRQKEIDLRGELENIKSEAQSRAKKLEREKKSLLITRQNQIIFFGTEKITDEKLSEIKVDTEEIKMEKEEIKELTQKNSASLIEIDQKENEISKLKDTIQVNVKKIESLSLENKTLAESNNTMTQKIDQLNNDVKALKDEKTQLQKEIEAKKDDDMKENEVIKRKEIEMKDREIIGLKEEKTQLKKEMEVRDQEIAIQKEEISQIKKEIDVKDKVILYQKDELNTIRDKNNQLIKEIEVQGKDKGNLVQKEEINPFISEMEIKDTDKYKELQSLKDNNIQLQKELESNMKELINLKKEINQLKNNREVKDKELITQKEEAKEELLNIDQSKQLEDKLIQIKELTDEIETKNKQIINLQSESIASISTIENQNEQLTDLKKIITDLNTKIKELEAAGIQNNKIKNPDKIEQQQQLYIRGMYDKTQLDLKLAELSSLKTLLNSFNNSSSISSKEKLSLLLSSINKNESIVNTHIQQNTQLKTELDSVNKAMTALINLLIKYFSINKINPSNLASTEEQFKQIKAHITKSQSVISENTRLNTLAKTLHNQLAKSQLQQSKLKEEVDKYQKEGSNSKDKDYIALKNENLTLKQIMIEMKNKENSEYDLVTQSLNSLAGQFIKFKTDIINNESSFMK